MKAWEGLSKGLIEEVHKWGAMKQTGVSLLYMMEFGSRPIPRNLLISAQFLHKELPVRIARRAIELHSLPYGLSKKPAVLKVALISTHSFSPALLPTLFKPFISNYVSLFIRFVYVTFHGAILIY